RFKDGFEADVRRELDRFRSRCVENTEVDLLFIFDLRCDGYHLTVAAQSCFQILKLSIDVLLVESWLDEKEFLAFFERLFEGVFFFCLEGIRYFVWNRETF